MNWDTKPTLIGQHSALTLTIQNKEGLCQMMGETFTTGEATLSFSRKIYNKGMSPSMSPRGSPDRLRLFHTLTVVESDWLLHGHCGEKKALKRIRIHPEVDP